MNATDRIPYQVTYSTQPVFESDCGPLVGHDNVQTRIYFFDSEEDAAEFRSANYEIILSMVRAYTK